MKIVKWTLISASAFLLILVGFVAYTYMSFNNTNPRDLGVTYTQEDLDNGLEKLNIEFTELPANTLNADAWQTFGEQEISWTTTNAEMTAILNNRPGTWNPYSNLQVKFNADGSGEISGNLDVSKLDVYGATFGAPQEAIDVAKRILPDNAAFYVKGVASMKDNNIALFEPQKVEVGRVSIPLGPLLADNPLEFQLVPKAHAIDVGALFSEINSLSNKEQLAIEFINGVIHNIDGLYAEEAYFEEDAFHFDGTFPEQEASIQN